MNSKYTSIIQAANAQGVTIWALDASGLTVDDMIGGEPPDGHPAERAS